MSVGFIGDAVLANDLGLHAQASADPVRDAWSGGVAVAVMDEQACHGRVGPGVLSASRMGGEARPGQHPKRDVSGSPVQDYLRDPRGALDVVLDTPLRPRPLHRDCFKIGVFGPTRRTEVRRDGHCE
jgi:hypothetical protein